MEAEAAARWEALVRDAWAAWEARFSVAVPRPAIRVGVGDVAEMPRTLGRTRGGRIELNRLLPREGATDVLRHETAHVFLEAACPSVAAGTPLLSEAFALFATGDAERRAFQDASAGSGPLGPAEARRWLLTRGASAQGHEPAAQKALALALAEPRRREAWEGFFKRLVTTCGSESFAASAEEIAFFALVKSDGAPPPPARVDFVLVDGFSHDELASEGKPDERAPPGSILKPLLVATVPELMDERLSRAAPPWACPDPPRAGESWTWRRALVRSCNGFFLDFEPSTPDAFDEWRATLERFGRTDPPTTMPGRIGLDPSFTLSPREAVRLYAWIARRAPFVIEALTKTPVEGTLASAPDAAWFAERGIALKTGTLRDASSKPLHGWIVAVGAPDESGAPAFLAALHATAVAPAALLPELRRRLEAADVASNVVARVQILGLAPFTTIGLACPLNVQLLVRDPAGTWTLRPAGERVLSGALETGSTYACAAAPLLVSFTDSKGRPKTRPYAGTLQVEEPRPPEPAEALSSVPLRAKSVKARRGSRLVLTTSERSYLESSLLSEFPNGHIETLKALTLVMRHQLKANRHPGRPLCDTTHCHLYGQEEGVTPANRRTARAAVAAVRDVELVDLDPPADSTGTASERPWLTFWVGGRSLWKTTRTAAATREVLGLSANPSGIQVVPGAVIVAIPGFAHLRIPCELFRNQLRLPSCPTRVTTSLTRFAFEGLGDGHGAGLDLGATEAASAAALGYDDILLQLSPRARNQPASATKSTQPQRQRLITTQPVASKEGPSFRASGAEASASRAAGPATAPFLDLGRLPVRRR